MFNISIKRYLKEARAEETRKLHVDESKVRIGTGAGNEIQLEGAGISINHAVIEMEGGNTCWITDVGSSDGTFVNNKLISERQQVSDSDEITIGLYNISVKLPASSDDSINIIINETQSADEDYSEELPGDTKEVTYVSKFKLSGKIISVTTLSVVGIIIMILLSFYWLDEDSQSAYSPGPLSSAHTQFNDDCAKCHMAAWVTVQNEACLSCHEVIKAHNKNENFTPECVACHIEHHGNTVLAEIQDTECTQCHAELVTVNFIPSDIYERYIEGFESGHPEFAVIVMKDDENGAGERIRLSDKNNLSDNTPIKLNHSVHLKEGLRGSEGPVNLNCEHCHRVDSAGEYTMAIEYERDCSSCHTLEFDIRFGNLTVPHSSTNEVIKSLINTYTSYALDKNISDPRGWASVRVKETSGSLFRTKCAECHILEDTAQINEVTQVIEPEIPMRWLPHGKFDHELHVKNLNLKCDACHNAYTSKTTQDVLMPSINTCLECHSAEGGAITDCALCHNYHEGNGSEAIEGTKTIEEVLGN